MKRSAWSPALLSVLALGLFGAPGCVGKRRPQADGNNQRDTPTAAQAARLIQPEDVDGSLDAKVEGSRLRARYDERDPSDGAALPLVTIVEYSDFQCPYCSRLANTLHEVARDYPQDVKLVFKQFPLKMHRNAEPAARASLAAHEQGKFWEMHDQMFANQKALSDEQLEAYAVGLGLDMDKWRTDFASPTLKAHVDEEFTYGRALGISSTPTFFVNGKLHKGAQQAPQIKAIIDGEILAARALLQAGAKREELYARMLHPSPIVDAPKPAPTPGTNAAAKAVPPKPDLDANHKFGEASRVPNYAVPVGQGRPSKGPADALVTIVEFGAYDCDNCRAVQPALNKVLAKYPKDVRLVFRQLADENVAKRSAQMAVAAHKQGKFWLAHDALMKMDGDLTPESAEVLAKGMKVDVEAFQAELRNREPGGPLQQIQADMAVVDVFRSEAPAPLFFVNGRYLDELPTFEEFDALVVEEKAKAEAFARDKGVTDKATLYDAMLETWRGYDRVQGLGG